MSTFATKLRLANLANPTRVVEIEGTVDTGASYSWVSRATLESVDIKPTSRMQFETITGDLIEREMAPVFVSFDGRSGGDTVVVGEPGDMQVIGAHTLEAMGVLADPIRKTLVPTIGLALMALKR